MAFQQLLTLQLLMILGTSTVLSYPLYGSKRYGRSTQRASGLSWSPYQTMIRSQRYPVNYYTFYPYSQNYPDEYYYPQETYPVYYPRTSKYEVYQAVLPYYYQDRPVEKPAYTGYYDYDVEPSVDLQSKLIQEAEREQREESQPIGHELLYENEDNYPDENLDDVNAAFLQNLIMSQMYKDTLSKQKIYEPETYEDYNDDGVDDDNIYGKWDDLPTTRHTKSQEDDDVKELKSLAKAKHQRQKVQPADIHWFQRNDYRKQMTNENKRTSFDDVPVMINPAGGFSDRKPIVILASSTTIRPTTTVVGVRREARGEGQKEEVLMRPATPVRHPFSNPVLEMMTKNDENTRKRSPSVYDTIKHMLEMEKSLANKYGPEEIKPPMKKRIISSDENLTKQLSVLKKSQ